MNKPCKLRFEIALTLLALGFTLLATSLFLGDILAALNGVGRHELGVSAFYVAIIGFLLYGNVGYQLTRLGHLKRLVGHEPAPRPRLEKIYARPAEPLLFLVPSYKEELRTVRQTLWSAALQEHPNRRVVLLIDDPYRFDDPEALAALVSVREVAAFVDAELRAAAQPFVDARCAFIAKLGQGGRDDVAETAKLGALFLQAAGWFEARAEQTAVTDHTDAFFIEAVLRAPARAHRVVGEELVQRATTAGSPLSQAEQMRHYQRLVALFEAEVSSFERKRFANLSHEPNKAMNLNTYIGLLGQSYREVERPDGTHLVETLDGTATSDVPLATYLITLDADSLLLPEYALRLIEVMERPGNERVAVAQTPYSAIPHATSALERTAGATTDIQYLVHQGFTHHRATFWVGANALLRRRALDEIAVMVEENGRSVRRYIQDRTVIEDTESTVDLIDKGWSLFNYPERLAYSATPPDFGSLVVQRGRWANGGLIILPKLLRYLLSRPNRLQKMREGFFRVHYLTSIAGVNLGLIAILAYPFPESFSSPWLPLAALPYYALYARDLWQTGYRNTLDLVRVYALNLLLLPVNVGGVLRSLHQACKGHRIPFLRTPKVCGRTCVPARYVAAIFASAVFCIVSGLSDLLTGSRWEHGSFALLNGAVLVYAIGTFIGFGPAWDDLHRGIDEWLKRAWAARLDRQGA